MLMRKDYAPDRNREVLKFLDWALHDGQADSMKLDYVPLADTTVKQVEGAWTSDLKSWP